jgi:hypothetical protein
MEILLIVYKPTLQCFIEEVKAVIEELQKEIKKLLSTRFVK